MKGIFQAADKLKRTFKKLGKKSLPTGDITPSGHEVKKQNSKESDVG